MAKGRAVAIELEAAEKSELTALTRKHGAAGLGGAGADCSGCRRGPQQQRDCCQGIV
jgi:hypothetical protein